ncbi:hypothetical protein [Pyxidicoccus xibeiensis]|uniref:hypothetical protein n=1 Tax=Pyxidicoccus xibeiensis TaxID=2906759 RepID=UPI0020A7B950|nr:hypothetical protein [Pyxidicoccus xibeiensis]MCP3143441.1 hypothetical protein [Pyxidicoccus xibeiensis]
MQAFKHAVWVCAAVSLSACGVPEEPSQQEALAEQQAALVTGTSQGCTFTISSAQIPNVLPPRWRVTLTRSASVTCAPGAGSLVLGESYNPPSIALLANSLGVATAFPYKHSPSGSSNIQCKVNHIDPATLAVVRDTNIVAYFGMGNITSCNLDQTDAGATLVVYGMKTGALPGEVGNKANYVATYYDFFTSTTPPVYYTY